MQDRICDVYRNVPKGGVRPYVIVMVEATAENQAILDQLTGSVCEAQHGVSLPVTTWDADLCDRAVKRCHLAIDKALQPPK